MPNFVIVQVDPLPTVGAAAKGASIAIVSAADTTAAMDAFAVLTGQITPVVAWVGLASAFTRYTNTSIVNRTSVAG
jgi:hypothetical protein